MELLLWFRDWHSKQSLYQLILLKTFLDWHTTRMYECIPLHFHQRHIRWTKRLRIGWHCRLGINDFAEAIRCQRFCAVIFYQQNLNQRVKIINFFYERAEPYLGLYRLDRKAALCTLVAQSDLIRNFCIVARSSRQFANFLVFQRDEALMQLPLWGKSRSKYGNL